MSTVFDSISLKGLRLAHLRQLSAYINERDSGPDAGWYYGNKDNFEKRHKDLTAWINSAIKYAASNDVVFPK